jgi:hypothetical protein
MKRVAFIILVLVLWLATWKGAGAKTHAPDLSSTQMNFPVAGTTVAPTPKDNFVSETKTPATFDGQNYRDETDSQ